MDAEPGSEPWHRRFQLLPPGEHQPTIVGLLAAGRPPELVWRNELGGQTWCLGEQYLKWSPDTAPLDLHREVERLRWLFGRYPVPELLDSGHDGQGSWILTAALAGSSAVSPAGEPIRSQPSGRSPKDFGDSTGSTSPSSPRGGTRGRPDAHPNSAPLPQPSHSSWCTEMPARRTR